MVKKGTLFCLLLLIPASLFPGLSKTGFIYLKQSFTAERKGDYYNAALFMIDAVKANPSSRFAQDRLLVICQKAVGKEKKKLSGLDRENRKSYEAALLLKKRYERLQESLRQLDSIVYYGNQEAFSFDFSEYEELLDTVFEKITADLYRAAVTKSLGSDKDDARQAALAFLEIEKYQKNYKDSRERYEKLRQKAMRQIVLRVEEENSFNIKGQEYFKKLLFSDRQSVPIGRFYEVIKEAEQQEDLSAGDEILTVSFFKPYNRPIKEDTIFYSDIREVAIRVHCAVSVRFVITDNRRGEVLSEYVFRVTEAYEETWIEYEGDWGRIESLYRDIGPVKKGKPVIPSTKELYLRLLKKAHQELEVFLNEHCE